MGFNEQTSPQQVIEAINDWQSDDDQLIEAAFDLLIDIKHWLSIGTGDAAISDRLIDIRKWMSIRSGAKICRRCCTTSVDPSMTCKGDKHEFVTYADYYTEGDRRREEEGK